jgi:hypothetical protein
VTNDEPPSGDYDPLAASEYGVIALLVVLVAFVLVLITWLGSMIL